jgi:hypothetical protein
MHTPLDSRLHVAAQTRAVHCLGWRHAAPLLCEAALGRTADHCRSVTWGMYEGSDSLQCRLGWVWVVGAGCVLQTWQVSALPCSWFVHCHSGVVPLEERWEGMAQQPDVRALCQSTTHIQPATSLPSQHTTASVECCLRRPPLWQTSCMVLPLYALCSVAQSYIMLGCVADAHPPSWAHGKPVVLPT